MQGIGCALLSFPVDERIPALGPGVWLHYTTLPVTNMHKSLDSLVGPAHGSKKRGGIFDGLVTRISGAERAGP